jgi:hypothetical protein
MLLANLADAEAVGNVGNYTLTPTGFTVSAMGGTANTYIYLAIRRSNKPPTSGTQVFQPTVYTGTNVDNRLVNTGILTDMVWARQRSPSNTRGFVVGDRLRGQPYLGTFTSNAELADNDSLDQQIVSTVEYGTAFSSMAGFWCGNDLTSGVNADTTASNHIVEAFRRAPGFFDVACYTGVASGSVTVNHSLGVIPELIITKARTGTQEPGWYVGSLYLQNGFDNPLGHILRLDTNAVSQQEGYFTSVTSASFVAQNPIARSGQTYVAYFFASLPGISKVGSYTGNGGTVNTNGTSQTINCGFATGARFVLIKRTDSTGDWFVFDTARGIVAGNDPYLLTNSTAAEVTSVDAVDTDNTGFIVNQTSGTNLNVTGATYIYLAIA